jgi:MFS family permease
MTRTVVYLLTGIALVVSYSATMVIPGLPDLEARFGTTAATISWIPALYILVGAISVPLFSRLGDRLGKKRVLLVVMGLFSFGTLLAGFAWNLPSLLAFRVVQAPGLAAIPLAIGLIRDEIDPSRMNAALGMVSSVNGVGGAIGLVGGAWVSQQLGSLGNYRVLAPIAIVLTLALWWQAKESGQEAPAPVDFAGSALLALTVATLLGAVSLGGVYGWGSLGALVMIALTGVFALLLLWTERRASAPILGARLLTTPTIRRVNVAMIGAGAALFLGFYLIVYYAQEPGVGLGLDISRTALATAPAAVLLIVLAPQTGRLVQRIGPWAVELLGSGLVIAGFVSLRYFHSEPIDLAVGTSILFAGVALLFSALPSSIIALSPPAQAATEVGVNTVFRYIGQSLGIASAGAFLTAYLVPGTSLPSEAAYAYTADLGIAIATIGLIVLATVPHRPLTVVRASP